MIWSIQAACLLLLALSFASMDAGYVLRKWESTGIVNGTTENVFTCKDSDSKTVQLHNSRRCNGNADCKDKSDEKKCTECRTPFSLVGTDGYLECYTMAQVKKDKQDKEDRESSYYYYSDRKTIYPNCSATKLEPIWKKWKPWCKDGEVRDLENACLPESAVCDGVVDCPRLKYEFAPHYSYFSEEHNCTECRGGATLCEADSKCIAAVDLCNGYSDCSDGSDEQNCTVSTCQGALCSSGECIKSEKVCDGVIDCEDASDEQACTTGCGATVTNATVMPEIVTCDGERYLKTEVCTGKASADCAAHHCSDECDCDVAFKCPYGRCISKAQVCDGKRDCPWGEDEELCLSACAKYPFFSCINNGKVKCMSMSAKCDGVRDCSDGKDEKNCAKCPAGTLKCDGGCVPGSARCDGVKDCKDGSDEKDCSCEECNKGRLDTYSCERSKVCMKRSAACRRGKSRCSNATARDELFCQIQAGKKNFKEGEGNSRV